MEKSGNLKDIHKIIKAEDGIRSRVQNYSQNRRSVQISTQLADYDKSIVLANIHE